MLGDLLGRLGLRTMLCTHNTEQLLVEEWYDSAKAEQELELKKTADRNQRREMILAVATGGVCIALSYVLSLIKLFEMPQGGAVTPASMLPLLFFCLCFGAKKGFCATFGYSLLQLIGGYFMHPVQVLLDYTIAFTILGVASNWDDDKGVKEFEKLSQNPDYQVIMVGVNEKMSKQLPDAIMKVARTNSLEELAKYYSMADVFVNPTYKDTFPTTNLEAMTCGTPVITYKTGGSPESITPETGIVVEKGDFGQLCEAIETIRKNGKPCYSVSCRERAEKFYNKDDRFKDYIDLYENILDNSHV